jgi:predicted TIM-barrel fold metal-dependent hydrolase
MNHDIIDHHYHLSNKNLQEDIIDMKKNIKKYNIKKIITMATYFPKRKSGLSNYRLFKHIEKIPEVFMLASLDFEHYYYQHINELLELMTEEKVIGLKIYSGYQKIDFKSKEFKDIIEIGKNKIIMFHTGYCHIMKYSFNPMELEEILKEYKDTKFILAHLSNPFSNEIIYLLNTYQNVYTDVSGLIETERDINNASEYLNKIIEKIKDKNKILFGTDFPVQNYEDSFEILGENLYILKNTIL